jgi:hypothetical protein
MSHGWDDSRPVPLAPAIFAADSEPCSVCAMPAIARLDGIDKVCNRRRLLLQHGVQSRQQLFVVRNEPIVGAELVPLENTLDVEVILLGQTER